MERVSKGDKINGLGLVVVVSLLGYQVLWGVCEFCVFSVVGGVVEQVGMFVRYVKDGIIFSDMLVVCREKWEFLYMLVEIYGECNLENIKSNLVL